MMHSCSLPRQSFRGNVFFLPGANIVAEALQQQGTGTLPTACSGRLRRPTAPLLATIGWNRSPYSTPLKPCLKPCMWAPETQPVGP